MARARERPGRPSPEEPSACFGFPRCRPRHRAPRPFARRARLGRPADPPGVLPCACWARTCGAVLVGRCARAPAERGRCGASVVGFGFRARGRRRTRAPRALQLRRAGRGGGCSRRRSVSVEVAVGRCRQSRLRCARRPPPASTRRLRPAPQRRGRPGAGGIREGGRRRARGARLVDRGGSDRSCGHRLEHQLPSR